MYFACTHVTLRATEVPVWLEVGVEVIPEEVDTAVLNLSEALQYDDIERHEVLRQCSAASTLTAEAYQSVRRCRLRQRQGALSAEEKQFFNRHIDIIYIATDLALAVAIKRWFQGEVIFRYFGAFENLRVLGDMVVEHEPEDLSGIVCLPIFKSLYEMGIERSFTRSALVHGFVSKAALSAGWRGVRANQSAVVVMNNVRANTVQAKMLARIASLAETVPISILGKNDKSRVPAEIAGAFNVRGFLKRSEFLDEFAGSRFLIHPHAERYHNHYSNLEAVSMGIPVLFRTANPLYLEQSERLRRAKPAEWFGAFETEEELLAAAERFFLEPRLLKKLVRRQRRLLAPYSRRAVLRETKAAMRLLQISHKARPPVEPMNWPHARLACNETLRLQQGLIASGATIPFASLAREDDWKLLAQNDSGDLVMRLPRGTAARQFIVGDGFSLRQGWHYLSIQGDLPINSIVEITLEIFTGDYCVAVDQMRVTTQLLPKLLIANLGCQEGWLLSVTINLLQGDWIDVLSLTLERLSDHDGKPEIQLERDGVGQLLEGRPVPLAILPVALEDHQIAWDEASPHPVVRWTGDDEPLKIFLGREKNLPLGQFSLDIAATGDPGTVLMATAELFQDSKIVGVQDGLAMPGNDGAISLQFRLNATRPCTVLLYLRALGARQIVFSLIKLESLGPAQKTPSVDTEQTGETALLAGRNVPIESLISSGLQGVASVPAQLSLPTLGERWAGVPLRVFATFTADKTTHLWFSAALWNQHELLLQSACFVELGSGRTIICLDLVNHDPEPNLTPLLFFMPEGELKLQLTHLRIARINQPDRPTDALVPAAQLSNLMDNDMKFYGQFNPPVDRFIFERYFPDTNIKGVFVECGGFDGVTDSSCKFFEETMCWTGFNLEPVPNLFALLDENRPLARNLQMALSDTTGMATFTHAIHPVLGEVFGNGSLGHADAHRNELEAADCTFETFTVATITWRDFIKQEAITCVDLLVLDVEGHELLVLDGMRNAEVMPAVMCVEFGHLGLETVREKMRELNYEYDIQSQGNAFFVKRDLLGLFALRRAGVSQQSSVEGVLHSLASGASGNLAGGEIIDAAKLFPAELMSVKVIGDKAYAGVLISDNEMTVARLPELKQEQAIKILGFDLHLVVSDPGSIKIILENWGSSGFINRMTRTSTVAAGSDVVSVLFPPILAETSFNAVFFLEVSEGCNAMLTHVKVRQKTLLS
jgi:FkbM family methyltransferase